MSTRYTQSGAEGADTSIAHLLPPIFTPNKYLDCHIVVDLNGDLQYCGIKGDIRSIRNASFLFSWITAEMIYTYQLQYPKKAFEKLYRGWIVTAWKIKGVAFLLTKITAS